MPFRLNSNSAREPEALLSQSDEQALDLLVSAPASDNGLFTRIRPLSSDTASNSNKNFRSLQHTNLNMTSGSTNELYLLEQAQVIGRKTELRQLLKLINLSRQGHPKAVLVSGDTGMGKTALLDSFCDLVRQAIYTRMIDCRLERFKTAQHLYVSLIDSLRLDAQQLLEEALAAINEGLSEVGLHWETQDLIRSVSLVQMQETLDPTANVGADQNSGQTKFSESQRIASEAQLLKAIKNSVPTIKKLRLSMNTQVEKIVKLILNPWVITACHLSNPMDARLKSAFALSDEIKKQGRLFDAAYTQEWEVKRPQFFQVDEDHLESQRYAPMDFSKGSDDTITMTSSAKSAYGSTKQQAKKQTLQGPLEEMASGLQYVLHFINRSIQSIDSSLLILFDNWEAIAELPHQPRNELKILLQDLLTECCEQSDAKLMFLVASDSAYQSKSLGGPLFSQFRTKILLSSLEEAQARKLFRNLLQANGIQFDENVHQAIFQITEGNPYWHNRMALYILERALANRIQTVTMDFYQRLCIEKAEDLLDLAYTRVKLTCLEKEDALEKVVAALLNSFSFYPFEVRAAIQEISLSQNIPEAFVAEVLERLTHYHFLSKLPNHPAGMPFVSKHFQDAWLVIGNQIDRQYLKNKTVSVQTDLPTDDKLAFLKKVIPLSIQSGELDRSKTQEVLSLCHSLGNTDIVDYLETLFIDSLKAEKPAVRVTAVNNLALIDSEKSRHALLMAMKDSDAMVREYAAQNLGVLSQTSFDADFHRILVDVLQESLDDESEAVRAQAYQTLGKYRWSHNLTTVFIKGLSDIDPSVRICSVKFLAEMDPDSPFIQNSLLDALDDSEVEVRRYACHGIQRYTGPDIIQALITRLRTDNDASIRALAADSLSFMETDSALQALALALTNTKETEDVKLAVVRTLGKRSNASGEQILLNAAHQDADLPPALLWAIIRSLGQVGTLPETLYFLNELEQHSENIIIQGAAKLAKRKVEMRIAEQSSEPITGNSRASSVPSGQADTDSYMNQGLSQLFLSPGFGNGMSDIASNYSDDVFLPEEESLI